MQKKKKMVCFAGVFFCAVCCAAVDLFFAAFFVAGEKIFIYYIYIYILGVDFVLGAVFGAGFLFLHRVLYFLREFD